MAKIEVVDFDTGEVKKAEVLVAVLPFSLFNYVEACWSQERGVPCPLYEQHDVVFPECPQCHGI